MFQKLRHIFFKFVLGLEVAKYVQTKYGNALLLDRNGYVYGRNARNGSKMYWCCRNKDKDACLARATTDDNYVTYWKGLHTHPPNILDSDTIM